MEQRMRWTVLLFVFLISLGMGATAPAGSSMVEDDAMEGSDGPATLQAGEGEDFSMESQAPKPVQDEDVKDDAVNLKEEATEPQKEPSVSRIPQGVGYWDLIGKRPQVILFGDSLTEQAMGVHGWGSLMAESYTRKADVFNRGYSGYNSNLGAAMMRQFSQEVLGKHDTDGKDTLFLVFFGANDATGPGSSLHVSMDNYSRNLKEIVNIAKSVMPGIQIIFLSAPPVDEEKLANVDWFAESGRSMDRAGIYAGECARAADAMGVFFFDVYSLMISQDNWKDMLSDGLHLSPVGHRFLHKELLKYINYHYDTDFRRLHPDQLPRHMPPFSKFKGEHVETIQHICEWPDEKGQYCVTRGPPEDP